LESATAVIDKRNSLALPVVRFHFQFILCHSDGRRYNHIQFRAARRETMTSEIVRAYQC